MVTHNIRQPAGSSQSPMSRSMLDSVDLSDDAPPSVGPRIPPPVQPAQAAPVRRDTTPSVSIEQAAKPTFDITVGDPHKVGDLTSSHIVYLVRTRVMMIISEFIICANSFRPHPRPTGNPNSMSLDDTETFYGFIINYMRIIRVSLFLHHPRSKLWGDLTPTLWNREELLWSAC